MHRVKDIPLFTKLSEKSIKKLEDISLFRSYSAGEIVFYEGDDPGNLYILLDGVLRMYKTKSNGTQMFIHQFTPVSLVGELANFENMPYPATAEFITKGSILKIDFKRLENDFFRNPDISMEIIRSLARKIKILSNVLHREMILTSEAKVAKFIVENYELFSKLKNSQIASLLNITPETLSRILTKLKNAHFINIGKKHDIEILDKTSLKKLYE